MKTLELKMKHVDKNPLVQLNQIMEMTEKRVNENEDSSMKLNNLKKKGNVKQINTASKPVEHICLTYLLFELQKKRE